MHKALVTGLVLAAIATLAACGGGGSKGGSCGAACNGCCLGATCVAGTDPTGCGSGSNNCAVCATGQVCTAGLCQTGTTPAVADKCATNADCGTALVCSANVPGGGYCTLDCTPSTVTCPSGSTCVTESDGTKDCEKSCAQDTDCRTEHLCFKISATAGVCRPKCTQDNDCLSRACNTSTGVCGATRVGTACAAATQATNCGQLPASCDTTNPAGSCTLPCGGDQQAACPAGTNCASSGGSSECQPACAQQSDCRSGFNCVSSGGVSSCLPVCTGPGTCPGAQVCNTTSGLCVEGGPAAGQLGGACASPADCTTAVGANALCVSTSGGYCSLNCNTQGDCAATNGTCVAFTNGNFCMSKCAVASDCRGAYYCYQFGGGNGGACLAKCQSNADCNSPNVCDKTGGLCVAPSSGSGTTVATLAMTPQVVTVYTDHLDDTQAPTVDVEATSSSDFPVSVTFIGQAVSDPTARVVVYRITAPDGSILYDYGAQASSKMKVLPSIQAGVFSVLLPNSPNVTLTTGTYKINLLATKQTTVTATALVKHSQSQSLLAGNLDMNLFFVGLSNLNATSAPNDANFQSVLTTVKTTWGNAGIGIGNVKYIDVTGANATMYTNLKDSDLGTLMTLSNDPNASPNALNVFFVQTISGGSLDGYIILGESAGIPGAPILGTTGSGMAVTTANFPNGLADIADTWVHEGSHWLGLFHTTESAGTAFDPLGDTPQCDRSHDANGDGIMQPNECIGDGALANGPAGANGGDANDEMFWTSVDSIPHSTLTPNQSYVMLRNPAVH